MATCKYRWGNCIRDSGTFAVTHSCAKVPHKGRPHRCWWCGKRSNAGIKGAKTVCGSYTRHDYELQLDSDGNYRVCRRCKKCSLRLAVGEHGRVRFP